MIVKLNADGIYSTLSLFLKSQGNIMLQFSIILTKIKHNHAIKIFIVYLEF